MKFTLSWLREHLDTDADLERITETLTATGLEVEDIYDPAKIYAPFIVAYIQSVEPHPNADKLQVCHVDTGDGGESVQVICGAPNARAGMKGVFAAPGTYIPGSDMTLEKGKIRGVESAGMLVSEYEMGLSEDHEGIIELDDSVALGTSLADIYGLNEPVIEIGLTPNRGDCAGVRGIARDLAAAGLGTLKAMPHETAVNGEGSSPVDVELVFDDADSKACPLFVGYHISGVHNGESPQWLQDRLKAIGLRPISVLVDITNYINFDLCRPLHVYDADKLSGNIHVRFARDGETVQALDECAYNLDEDDIAICDDSGVIGIGGIIGGESTAVDETTTNVFVECAWFDPKRIARTGRDLQIVSDARYRFERGVDPTFTPEGAAIATNLVTQLCGGTASRPVQAGAPPDVTQTISYNPEHCRELTALHVDHDQQADILEKLGFTVVQKDAGNWRVTTPPWRHDIGGAADLVEEIVRIIGYDRVVPVHIQKDPEHNEAAEDLDAARMRMARATCTNRGLKEIVSWSFMNSGYAKGFAANDNALPDALYLANPIVENLDVMRPSILPNLIEAAGRNAAKGFADTALFEVGPVFTAPGPEGEITTAAGLRSRHIGPRHWASAEAHRHVDVFDAKADALDILARMGMSSDKLQVSRDAPGCYHPGRSGTLRQGKRVLAHFGEIHPDVLEAFDVAEPVAGFEVFLDAVPAARRKSRGAPDLIALQPVRRDFAVLVDQGTPAQELVRAAMGAEKNLIADVRIFDVYTGTGVPEGKQSIGLEVTLQPRERTLTESDISDVSDKIINALNKHTGAELRGAS